MSIQDLPLLELFTRLQKAGLPLGIDEYQLVLQALQAGFGISEKKGLKRLCQTLWIKSAEESRLLDYHFEQLILRPTENVKSTQLFETLSEQLDTPSEFPIPPSERIMPDSLPAGISEAVKTKEMTVNIEDEIQVAQAVLHVASTDDETPTNRYISSDEYFPVTRRQMKQSWRYLRRPIREGLPVELDIEATVNEVGRNGMLLEPILVPRRINRAELLLLIDHGGSMVPFHMLSHRLIETILRGGRLERASIYYFHNYPLDYLYRDPTHQEYERIEEVLMRFSQTTGILVFSDAGAARGGFSQERIDSTKKFLERFKRQFLYIAWLNPMPSNRWLGTTAEMVMQSVPMFDMSRPGLDNAISALRGHPMQFIYSLRHK